jgi:hypothetical protein
MPLPNFFIIGANKAGTTSLYRYLGQHPQIFFGEIKEPSYYTFEKGLIAPRPTKASAAIYPRLVKTLSAYKHLFDDVTTETAIGDASTTYLTFPRSAETIKRHRPQSRIVAVLRNNADRAYSQYSMYAEMGWEDRTFEDVIEDEVRFGGRGELFVDIGFYNDRLKAFYDAFGSDAVRVYLYEDLERRPRWLVRDIFAFLGVDPHFSPDMSARFNASTPRAPMKEATKRLLTDLYREDNAKLQSLIQRDLHHWMGPPADSSGSR